MTSIRTIFHRAIIVAFLGLLGGVVYLQVSSDLSKPLAASVVGDSASKSADSVCGDRICGAAETCGNCEQDCGQCKQSYCCQIQNRSCDGPFGSLTVNPCDAPGYNPAGFRFDAGSDSARADAFASCQQACL